MRGIACCFPSFKITNVRFPYVPAQVAPRPCPPTHPDRGFLDRGLALVHVHSHQRTDESKYHFRFHFDDVFGKQENGRAHLTRDRDGVLGVVLGLFVGPAGGYDFVVDCGLEKANELKSFRCRPISHNNPPIPGRIPCNKSKKNAPFLKLGSLKLSILLVFPPRLTVEFAQATISASVGAFPPFPTDMMVCVTWSRIICQTRPRVITLLPSVMSVSKTMGVIETKLTFAGFHARNCLLTKSRNIDQRILVRLSQINRIISVLHLLEPRGPRRLVGLAPVDLSRMDPIHDLQQDHAVFKVLVQRRDKRFDAERIHPERVGAGFAVAGRGKEPGVDIGFFLFGECFEARYFAKTAKRASALNQNNPWLRS